jgi:hypothetical protein
MLMIILRIQRYVIILETQKIFFWGAMKKILRQELHLNRILICSEIWNSIRSSTA